MTKHVLVETNDPGTKKFTLTVSGTVERVATIKPQAVYMHGRPGQTLESVITITPSEKYMFSILSMTQNPNSPVRATLQAPEEENGTWRVSIRVDSDREGNIFDNLVFKTDSAHKPQFRIRVAALFHKNS